MSTIKETALEVGDVFRPRRNPNGFTAMIVIEKKENNLVTVKRPFCYGKEKGYEAGVEQFSFWLSESFDVDLYERR